MSYGLKRAGAGNVTMGAGRTEGQSRMLLKVVGKPYEGEPHVRFEAAGAGNVTMGAGLRAIAKVMEYPPDPNAGAPVLDPTRLRPCTLRATAFAVRARRESYAPVDSNGLTRSLVSTSLVSENGE